jgi:hypothetical protein
VEFFHPKPKGRLIECTNNLEVRSNSIASQLCALILAQQ